MISNTKVGGVRAAFMRVSRRAPKAAPWLPVPLLCLLGTACASGGGGTGAAAAPAPLAGTRGFDGGTQVRGGFTNVASAIEDSVVAEQPIEVWAVLPEVFESLGIETPTVDRATLTIGNPGARVARIGGSSRLSSYLDCGMGILGPNADTYEVTLQLMVQLAGQPTGGTLVRTTVDAYARPRNASGDPIHCSSQRTLEGSVMQLIASRMREDGGGEGATADLAPMSPGRIPITGDFLRVECRSAASELARVGQGRLMGTGDGSVRLAVDARGRTVAVPARSMLTVQVRERKTYSVAGGIVGLVLGAAAGGFYADSRYDPDAENHYGPGFVRGIGVVVGGLAGGLFGRMLGSLVRSDTWHQAPPEWAIRTSGADRVAGATPEPALCPSFDGG